MICMPFATYLQVSLMIAWNWSHLSLDRHSLQVAHNLCLTLLLTLNHLLISGLSGAKYNAFLVGISVQMIFDICHIHNVYMYLRAKFVRLSIDLKVLGIIVSKLLTFVHVFRCYALLMRLLL